MTDQPAGDNQPDISARGATYFRLTRVGMLVLLVGIGAWFCYDGFIHWPADNAERARLRQEAEYTPTDIILNKALGIVLPPAGVFALAWGLWQSRGKIRLSGNILHVPGHKAIPLETIESMDTSRWERKGIAIVEYQPGDGSRRTFRLDDYVYERDPIDKIYEIVEKTMRQPGGAVAEPMTPARAGKAAEAAKPAPRVPAEKAPTIAAGPAAPGVRVPPPTRLPPRPKRGA